MRSSATASSGCCARPSTPRASEIPGRYDVVIKARPDVRELAERDGLAAVRTALAELLEQAGLRA